MSAVSTRRVHAARNGTGLLVVLMAIASGCQRPAPAGYQPRVRDITVTTVPLLVREARDLYPFLKDAFAPGGVLDGKEVYAFSPSTLTVVEGDTIHFRLINPEDDDHSFVVQDLAVPLPPQKITEATWVAKRAGIFPILCSVPSHLPMMSGQLVVLPASAMAGAETAGSQAAR